MPIEAARVVDRFAAMSPQALAASKALRKGVKEVSTYLTRITGKGGWKSEAGRKETYKINVSWSGAVPGMILYLSVGWMVGGPSTGDIEYSLSWELAVSTNGVWSTTRGYTQGVSVEDLEHPEVFIPADVQSAMKEAANPDTTPGAGLKKLKDFLADVAATITKGTEDVQVTLAEIASAAAEIDRLAVDPVKNYGKIKKALGTAQIRGRGMISIPTDREVQEAYQKAGVKSDDINYLR